MTEIQLAVLLVGLAAIAILQVLLLLKKSGADNTPVLQGLESVERTVRDEVARSREEAAASAREDRVELACNLKAAGDTLNQQLHHLTQSTVTALRELGSTQRSQLSDVAAQFGKLTESNQQKLDMLKDAVESRLRAIQEDNTKQLDLMRTTVDEKLQGALERRLGESFKLVSERLEQVHKGLGEMQTLATGVGDLKRVLTNVKTRGTWGEVQLGALLEQVLSHDQYAANVATKDGGERVEFAIKLPGRSSSGNDETLWLPIDAKFPLEDYQRLVDSQEKADLESAENAARQLELRIKQCAKDICDKYISPPRTTDFAILFLPAEGLFAEVIRRTGLQEHLQRHCRVVIAGPTTLWSILNSLQMGFRTLAIQKRSSEVWKILGAVRTEFGKFGTLLDGIKKKLDSASSTIDEAARKSRTIERKLRSVQELPETEAGSVLQIDSNNGSSAGAEPGPG
jgi:DNA recombination protein RmuC